jgi:hypothetical protein
MNDAFELLKRANPFIEELFSRALNHDNLYSSACNQRTLKETRKWLNDYDKLCAERANKDVIP